MKKIFFLFIVATNLYAQTVNTTGSTTPGSSTPGASTNLNTNPNTNMNSNPNFNNTKAPGVSSPTDTIMRDTVGNQQSSTVPSDCVAMKNEGTLCGPNAATWCNSHVGSVECNDFNTKKNINPTPSK